MRPYEKDISAFVKSLMCLCAYVRKNTLCAYVRTNNLCVYVKKSMGLCLKARLQFFDNFSRISSDNYIVGNILADNRATTDNNIITNFYTR